MQKKKLYEGTNQFRGSILGRLLHPSFPSSFQRLLLSLMPLSPSVRKSLLPLVSDLYCALVQRAPSLPDDIPTSLSFRTSVLDRYLGRCSHSQLVYYSWTLCLSHRIERRAFRAVCPIFDCEDSKPYKSLDKGAKAQLYVKELVLSGISKISV